MTFATLLINTCDVESFRETGTDGYGHPTGIWETIYTNEPCRHVSGKGVEIKVGQEVVIVYDELFIGDINITEQDRVVIDSRTYQVLSVLFRQDGVGIHHKHCFLEVVK